MNYLITGGRGFIGCHTMRQLLKEGHNIVCIAHNLDNSSIQEVMTEEEIAKIKIVVGQLSDKEFIINTIKENNIDKIIHLAAVLGDVAERDPAQAVNVNILGTINMFEAAVATGVKRVVWASSQSTFGTEEYYSQFYGDALVPNDVPLHPTLVYGGTKVFCEFIAEWYFKKYGLETIGLRYCLVYGVARQRGAGQFATECINKPALGLPGVVDYGETAPCWIYVEDAARATVIASQCPNPESRNFTIGGDITPLKDVAEYIKTLIPGTDITLNPGVYPAAFNLDCSAADKEMGFKCEYSIYDGVKETINLLRAKEGMPLV